MYELEKEEAHELKEYLREKYNVYDVTVVIAGGRAVSFKYELDGYEVEAEIHDHSDMKEVPIN